MMITTKIVFNIYILKNNFFYCRNETKEKSNH